MQKQHPLPQVDLRQRSGRSAIPGLGRRGSSAVAVVFIITAILILIATLTVVRRERRTVPVPQVAQQADARALYIAQTALDRSIKALVSNPNWRGGFEDVAFDDGTYDVHIYDGAVDSVTDDAGRVPPNYVRIVATSEVDGVRKEVEAIWVNASTAFQYAYAAGNRVVVDNEGTHPVPLLGNIHCNAFAGGGVDIGSGVNVFGDITSVGGIRLGNGAPTPAAVYGNVWGATLELRRGEIRRYENLSEWDEGLDLNGDGDTADIGLSKTAIQVRAAVAATSNGQLLRNGDRDAQIADGTMPVEIGGAAVGPIVDPRPDFATYYELVTGTSSYPPPLDHVSIAVRGDGDGHYFASSRDFLDWLRFQHETQAFCWRCAGDGRIDPANATPCPECRGTGRVTAVEVSGVFYVDDKELDLEQLGKNLIVHGTIVVADGNPYDWPKKKVPVPGGDATIPFPSRGRFVIGGENRMHFTLTYRSEEEGASYVWNTRTLFAGENAQAVPVPEPDPQDAMRDFPGIIAAQTVDIAPRKAGFAYEPGDIGDERMTILQGVVFADDSVRLDGAGGWRGSTIEFDETVGLAEDDALDEPVLNLDLNGDGDVFDRVEVSQITMVPVLPVGDRKYSVDINNDGVLGNVTIGADYLGFFEDHGYSPPALVYAEGVVLSQTIRASGPVIVVHDPRIAAAGIPFGFEVNFGSTTRQGLVSWWERHSP
jgi:hypothetical protein